MKGPAAVSAPLLGTDIYGVHHARRMFYRYAKVRCSTFGREKYCAANYKALSVDLILSMPALALARGSVFGYEDGFPAAIPFAKFFNFNEVPATRELPKRDFYVFEKLDGTLIVVWRDAEGQLHASTRSLLEDYRPSPRRKEVIHKQGEVVNPFVRKFYEWVRESGLWYELESVARDGKTVMFELVLSTPASKKSFEPEEVEADKNARAYLLAVRDNTTYELMPAPATAFPTPESYDFSEPAEVVKAVSGWDDKEGVVLYYPGMLYDNRFPWWNYLVKVKSPSYVIESMIYLQDGRPWWRKIAMATIGGRGDDIISYAKREKEEIREFVNTIRKLYVEMLEAVAKAKEQGTITGVRWFDMILRSADSDAALAEVVVRNLPRKKEKILKYLERLRNRVTALALRNVPQRSKVTR